MNSLDVKCRIMEEELKTFWSQRHVIQSPGGGTYGDVCEIYRDDVGIRGGKGTVNASPDAMIRKACAPRSEDRFQIAKDFEPKEMSTPGRNVPGPAGSPGIGPEGDEPDNRNSQKNDKPRFAIPAALLVITVLLICIGHTIKPGSHQSPSSSSASDLTEGSSASDPEEDPSASDLTESSSASDPEEGSSASDGDTKSTISDSWEEIIAAGEDGSYAEKYHIGDTKELDLRGEGIIHMKLAAMDADELADGSGKASMTWIAEELINSKHRRNPRENSTGWPESDMRWWLQESILPLLPDNLRSNIKEVTKYSYVYKNADPLSSKDTIWIPSVREVFGNDDWENKGPEYTSVFSDNESRVKFLASGASWWWLRTARGSEFNYVYTNGSTNHGAAHITGGVAIGFCLGTSRSSTASSEEDDRASGQNSAIWEEIIAAVKDGSYAEKYRIGDTRELDLGEEGVVQMELVAMDTDELADGSGKAHMTWLAKNLLKSKHCMNEAVTNEGGWQKSDMRAWLQDYILPRFPDNVRSNIKEVNKYSYGGHSGIISSKDMIWIPSVREIFGTYDHEESGPKYSSVFADDKSRVKYHASRVSWWWLRSANSDNRFDSVFSDGSNNNGIANSEGGVVIGFCF